MKQEEFNKKFVECITGENSENELLPFMKDTNKLSAMRALEVYREDYQVRLAEALKNTFRATHSILGDDDFFPVALESICRHPSVFSDLDEYGSFFPGHLEGHSLSEDYPFLPQLAQFEWSFRGIFHSCEVLGLKAADLQHAFTDESICLKLVPSAVLLHYDFAINKLYALKESEEVPENFDWKDEVHILLFKKNSLVKMHLLSKNQAALVKIFHTPCTLINCLKSAPATMTPEETQQLFLILGTEQILLKSL